MKRKKKALEYLLEKDPSKLNPVWVKEALDYFKKFLRETRFPHPVRNGERGSKFTYPEWLIMFIAVLAVKAKEKSYLAIHRLTLKYWKIITKGLRQEIKEKPIAESTLRDRLKKISYQPGKPPDFIFQIFPEDYLSE